MSRISDFIFANWRSLALIYTIGALVVFVGVLFFFWWICRLEEKERELCRYEDEASGRITAVISVFIAIPCALMWCVIPLIILAVWIYYEVAERFPKIMGHMADDFDDEEKEEIQ